MIAGISSMNKLLLATLCTLAMESSSWALGYTATVLSPSWADVTSFNNAGQLAGSCFDAAAPDGFRACYSPQLFAEPIELLGGTRVSRINDGLAMSGVDDSVSGSQSVFFSDPTASPTASIIYTFPGTFNAYGWSVGYKVWPSGSRLYLTDGTSAYLLPTLVGSDQAADINDSFWIAGSSGHNATILTPWTLFDVSSAITDPTCNSTSTLQVNNLFQAVIQCRRVDGSSSLYTLDVSSLGTGAPLPDAIAVPALRGFMLSLDSNSSGWFVGAASNVSGPLVEDAFVNTGLATIDLNTRISLPGVHLTEAIAIDEMGNIISQGTLWGVARFFYLQRN